jgi:hypothetical protein
MAKDKGGPMYYRVAMQQHAASPWQWQSTVLSSLQVLFQFLRPYSALPQDRLRVFSARSREEMDELLARENSGAWSSSVTAEQFLQERGIQWHPTTQAASEQGTREELSIVPIAVSTSQSLSPENKAAEPATTLKEWSTNALERRRFELERGAGGDHDVPYTFVLPVSMPQVLAWMRLLAKWQHGELHL